MIHPHGLLRVASDLAGVRAGGGRPRATDLRRAVSTAYYAVFHSLALAVARSTIPNGSDEEVHGVARHISHASILKVAEHVTGSNAPKHLGSITERLRRNPVLSTVVVAFVDLQQERERADYDHAATYERPRVVGLVSDASAAVDLIGRHLSTDDFQAFLGLVALRTSQR